MAYFSTDLEAFIVIIIIVIIYYIIGKVLSSLINKLDRLNRRQKVIPPFIYNLLSLILILFLVFNGFPIFESIDQQYLGVLIASVSTAIAFATSGVFSNLISGLVLLLIHPFDLGDFIGIKGDIGIVRSIQLTRTIIETTDNILIEKSNNELISSNITNYSIGLKKVKKMNILRQDILNKGSTVLDIKDNTIEEDKSIQNKINSWIKTVRSKKIHNYFFNMHFPYIGFDEKIKKVNDIAILYKSEFEFQPTYFIFTFDAFITVRFRILTDDAEKILEFQPKFAEEIARIIAE
ncbi:MAG: mechanosensitive ion channel [Candidatus Lokiarchaeota archaeon]|nr:mechanosensitive ion channel [Candidatus Lokiarchaeota archaeon]